MVSSVNTFKGKLQLLSTRLQCQDLRYFESMHAELQRQGKSAAQLNSIHYTERVRSVASESEKCFTDFASVEPVTSYMCFPFGTDTDVDDIASKVGILFLLDYTAVENEILTLQNNVQMKFRGLIYKRGVRTKEGVRHL